MDGNSLGRWLSSLAGHRMRSSGAKRKISHRVIVSIAGKSIAYRYSNIGCYPGTSIAFRRGGVEYISVRIRRERLGGLVSGGYVILLVRTSRNSRRSVMTLEELSVRQAKPGVEKGSRGQIIHPERYGVTIVVSSFTRLDYEAS